MRFSAHSYLFHFSLFISTRVFKFNIEHLRDTKKANRQFTISKKSLNRNCAANQFIYFKRARKITQTMCQIKILINVEQNPYWSIITSMLCSECWVFTEHLEHPENTPMLATATTCLRKKLCCPGPMTRRWPPPSRLLVTRFGVLRRA